MSYEKGEQENGVCPQHELSYKQNKKKQRVKFAGLFPSEPRFFIFFMKKRQKMAIQPSNA